MGKIITIKENWEFKKQYSRGKSFVSPVIVIYVMKNRFGVNRIGITTSKKTGNAVLRNRSRRVIKEAYRQLEPVIEKSYDFIFVARVKTPLLKSTVIKRHMEQQLKAAGAIK